MTPLVHHAFALATGRPIESEVELTELLEDPTPAWVHLRADDSETAAFLNANLSYLDPHIPVALTAAETRPRAVESGEGLLLILRSVNAGAGQEPEDMTSIRLWIDPARAVSMSQRDFAPVADVVEQFRSGYGPGRSGEFLCDLIEYTGERIDDFLARLGAETSALEERSDDITEGDLRALVSNIRRKVVEVRRYLAPQRDALAAVQRSQSDWIEPSDRGRIHEAHDSAVRAVEELDAIRDRLHVIKDDLTSALNERLNRNLYLLSIISVIFLPLGVLAGLFGVNLAGIPGAASPAAFWAFFAFLLAVVALQIAVLRYLRLI